jgi:hypothetical protein
MILPCILVTRQQHILGFLFVHSMPYFLIPFRKCNPRFLTHVNTVLIRRFYVSLISSLGWKFFIFYVFVYRSLRYSPGLTTEKPVCKKSTIFWDKTPCSPLKVNRSFGRTYRLHLQGRKIRSTIFWDITPCSPLKFNRRFGGTYRLHLQGRKMSTIFWDITPCSPLKAELFLPSAFMLVFFSSEDGGDMSLRNAS